MPWSKVLSFTDPFPYQEVIRGADVELYPTTRGQFRAELTQINMNRLWMQRFHEKLPQVFASKANNLQQSWRFDWEPPKAVLRDIWTIDWILGC